jgi:hypothetical protein
MNNEMNTAESTVTKENINIDEIFGAAPTGADVVTDENQSKPNIFSAPDTQVDMSFTEPAPVEETPDEEAVETPAEENVETTEEAEKPTETVSNSDLDEITNMDIPEELTERRGRKPITGMADVFGKLIKDDKIIPFDDDKSLDDYTAKDWTELIQANLDEKAAQVRKETPKQFFKSLPRELQFAAKYVADGGKDMRGLFATLAAVEETRQIDPKTERGQERIITDYLSATGFGNAQEIQEEIETWKDLGKLEQQAMKFKPKLDKMQEKVLAKKLQQQEAKKKQKENASKQYMNNVYETLKDGSLNDIKVDKRTQSMLFNGLVKPAYPSINGNNTNLLGHLLEKYQFVEPNYSLIGEALWLLADPTGYKKKLIEKGSQKAIGDTVRKLKTEQSSRNSGSAIANEAAASERTSKRKLPRQQNIFKRF